MLLQCVTLLCYRIHSLVVTMRNVTVLQETFTGLLQGVTLLCYRRHSCVVTRCNVTVLQETFTCCCNL